MNTSDQINIFTSVIALAAFLLSLYNFYIDRRDKSTTVIIRLSHGDIKKGKEKITQQAFFIEIVNSGHINIFITDVYILLGKQGIRIIAENIEDENFKTLVSPKENVVYWVYKPTKNFLDKNKIIGNIRVRAFTRDSLGKIHKSNVLIMHQSDFVN